VELQRPFALVTPTLDGDVLAALAGADAEFTAPQVHTLVGAHSVEGIRKALQRLSEQGIVTTSRPSHAVLYRLNRDHIAAPLILGLSRVRETLLASLSTVLQSWRPKPVVAALFGSAVTGRMRPDSDIDLFVVRPKSVDADDLAWTRQVRELERLVVAWTGNDARVLEYAASEFGDDHDDPVVDDIRRGGIILAGALPRGSRRSYGARRTENPGVQRRDFGEDGWRRLSSSQPPPR
jgi:predicted nucleotidyltransferase